MLTCHEAQKVFSERTIKLLSSIDAEFQQIEKYIACQKMLFFSRLFLVNCINPTLLHCHAVILTEQTKLYFPARHERRSTKEEERPMLPFFLQRIPSSPKMDCKRKDKSAKKALSQYIMMPGWTKLNCFLCPGSGQSPQA